MIVYLPLKDDPRYMDLIIKSVIALGLLVGSITMCLVTGVYHPVRDQDYFLNVKNLNQIIVWMGINVFATLIITIITNMYATTYQALITMSVTSASTFTILMAWSEEMLRGFLVIFGKRIGGDVPAIVISTAVWWMFHAGVYGIDLRPALILIGSGVILAISLLVNDGRVSITMLPHGLNNLIASLATKGLTTSFLAILQQW